MESEKADKESADCQEVERTSIWYYFLLFALMLAVFNGIEYLFGRTDTVVTETYFFWPLRKVLPFTYEVSRWWKASIAAAQFSFVYWCVGYFFPRPAYLRRGFDWLRRSFLVGLAIGGFSGSFFLLIALFDGRPLIALLVFVQNLVVFGTGMAAFIALTCWLVRKFD